MPVGKPRGRLGIGEAVRGGSETDHPVAIAGDGAGLADRGARGRRDQPLHAVLPHRALAESVDEILPADDDIAIEVAAVRARRATRHRGAEIDEAARLRVGVGAGRAQVVPAEADHHVAVARHAPAAGGGEIAAESEAADARRRGGGDVVERAFRLAGLRIDHGVADARAVVADGRGTRTARARRDSADGHEARVAGPVPEAAPVVAGDHLPVARCIAGREAGGSEQGERSLRAACERRRREREGQGEGWKDADKLVLAHSFLLGIREVSRGGRMWREAISRRSLSAAIGDPRGRIPHTEPIRGPNPTPGGTVTACLRQRRS